MTFRRTQTLGITQALQDAILDVLFNVNIAPLMAAPRLHLIANPSADLGAEYPPASLAADAPTFTGYTSQLVAPADLVGPVNAGGGRRIVHSEYDFVSTAVPTAEAIYGYVVTNTGSTILYAWEILETPVAIILAGDSLSLDLVWGVANELDSGG